MKILNVLLFGLCIRVCVCVCARLCMSIHMSPSFPGRASWFMALIGLKRNWFASFSRFSVVSGLWLCGKVRGMNSSGFAEWPVSFGASEGGRERCRPASPELWLSMRWKSLYMTSWFVFKESFGLKVASVYQKRSWCEIPLDTQLQDWLIHRTDQWRNQKSLRRGGAFEGEHPSISIA